MHRGKQARCIGGNLKELHGLPRLRVLDSLLVKEIESPHLKNMSDDWKESQGKIS